MPLLAGATRRTWRAEALMGVSLAAMSAPVAMAFAGFAGLPPVMGLYALIAPAFVFALFASTGRVTAAPDAVILAIVASTLAPLATPGTHRYVALAVGQALVVAIVFFVVAVTRAARVAVLLPRPVLIGLSAGVGFDFLVRELAAMFGISLGSAATSAAGSGFLHAGIVIGHLGDADVWAIAVAAGALAVLLLGRRVAPRLPWEIAVYFAALASYRVFGLAAKGVATVGGAGAIVGGRPHLTVPALTTGQWVELIPGALVIVFVALAQHQDAEPAYLEASTRDGVVYAAANAASGLSGAFAIGPSPARRARLGELRSTSQLPALVAAALILITLVFWSGFLTDIPTPAFAAIAAVATWPLLRLHAARALWQASKAEFFQALVVFATALVFGPLWAAAVAAAVGLLRLAGAASVPPFDVVDAEGRPIAALRHGSPPPRPSAPGIVVVRFAGPIAAASAGTLGRGIRSVLDIDAAVPVRHVVIDCEATAAIDATGAQVLRELLADAARAGITIDYCRTRAVLRVELERHGLLGGSRIFGTVREALDALA